VTDHPARPPCGLRDCTAAPLCYERGCPDPLITVVTPLAEGGFRLLTARKHQAGQRHLMLTEIEWRVLKGIAAREDADG
jgi:hypothetical protein